MSGAIAKKLDQIQQQTGVRAKEVANLVDTTPQTVSRWKSGAVDPQPDQLERIIALAWLAEQLSEFYEPDEARLWLFSPHRLLGGEKPADRIRTGKIRDVLQLIDQLRQGAYV